MTYRNNGQVVKANFKNIKEVMVNTNPKASTNGQITSFTSCHEYQNEHGETLLTDRATFTISQRGHQPTIVIQQQYDAVGCVHEHGGRVEITERQLDWLIKNFQGSGCC